MRVTCFFLILTSLFSFIGKSQSLSFEHFGIQDGLVDASAGPIWKDQKGFLWVGTSSGLSRFDGHQFKNYTYNPLDSSSFLGNAVTDIFEEEGGNLWIATRGAGINIYKWDTDNFFRIEHKPYDPNSLRNNYVNTVLQTADGRFWIGTDAGLNVSRSRELPLEFSTFPDTGHVLYSIGIMDLLEYPEGILWIGSSKNGLFRLDMESGNISHWYNEGQRTDKLAGNIIKDLLVTTINGKPYLWVASSGGLTQIKLGEKGPIDSRVFQPNPEDPDRLPNQQVMAITANEVGEIWLATFGGIVRVHQQEDSISFETYAHEDSSPESLSNDRVYDVFLDDVGILWVGTAGGGLNQVNIRHDKRSRKFFKHYLRTPNSLRRNVIQSITCLFEDREGYFWVGTEGGGLERMRENGEVLSRFYANSPEGQRLSHALITTMYQDVEGTFWIGTFGGFNRLTFHKEGEEHIPSIKQFVHQESDPNSLSDNHIFALHEDPNGKIWIGTRGGGLNCFDKSTEKFEVFKHEVKDPYCISNNYVWGICPQGDSGLWLATDLGVNYYNLHTERFYHLAHDPQNPAGLSHNFVNTIIKDKQGRLWVGTSGGGLNQFFVESLADTLIGSFKAYRKRDGLLEDIVYEIREDAAGKLWISSNRGLTRFDPEILKDNYANPSLAFRHFDKSDGLQDDEFNMGAAAKLRDGRMLFGGLNGFNLFDPDSIPLNQVIPPVYITGIEVLNQKLIPGSPLDHGNIPLAESPQTSEDLYLSYKDYMVSFEFALLNYLFPEDNRYAYKMEGLDNDWIYSGNGRRATYTNLAPGTYTFRVKASNNDGIWNEEGTSIQVHVSTPPWRSWWAYTLYALSGLVLTGGYVNFRVKTREQKLAHQAQIERVKLVEREQVRKETAADFHDELGNKMTKISLFAEMAKRSGKPDAPIQTYLDQLLAQTQGLSNGMRDFIWMLDPEKNSLYDLLIRLKEFGEQLFEHTGIDFRVSEVPEGYNSHELSLSFRRHLLLIVKEAFTNVLKHAQAKRVELIFEPEESSYRLKLVDNGVGFDTEKKGKGYGLKNMRERCKALGGSCEWVSIKGKGTTLTLNIPWEDLGAHEEGG
ncbi:MAG: two-component regulator propeller domain-containing protein [Bacteroidota bacterium]